MSYEVIKNNRATGIIIEAETVIGACVKYMQMPKDNRQYNVACVTVSFRQVR